MITLGPLRSARLKGTHCISKAFNIPFFLRHRHMYVCMTTLKHSNKVCLILIGCFLILLFRGLFLYKSVICTMRWTLLLSNTDLNMEILKITKHSDDNTVKVRWRIKGESRLRAWFNRRSKVPDGERYR